MVLSPAVRLARLHIIAASLDSAATGGLIRIYSAPRPAAGDSVTAQIMLAELELPKPPIADLADDTLTFAPIPEALCNASGTAAWARLSNGAGLWVADIDVGETGSGAELEMSSVDLLAGGAITVSLAQLHELPSDS